MPLAKSYTRQAEEILDTGKKERSNHVNIEFNKARDLATSYNSMNTHCKGASIPYQCRRSQTANELSGPS